MPLNNRHKYSTTPSKTAYLRQIGGNLNETQQAYNDNRSAYNPQDYYSNNLGYAFQSYFMEEVNPQLIIKDGGTGSRLRGTTELSIYIENFLMDSKMRDKYLNKVK
jgi:hypothetical protein